MKKSRINQIILISLSILTATIAASDSYAVLKIYKLKGDVTIKSGKRNLKATRRATVETSDVLTIPAGGSVEILDSKTHRIYSSTKTGKISVKSLIKKAESQASNITRNINRKVIDAVVDNASQKEISYDVVGVSIHETDAVVPVLINIPEGISYLSYLLGNPHEPDSLHQSFISLSRHIIESDDQDSDDEFNFVFTNSTTHPLYFNIVTKDDDQDIHLLMPRNRMADPKSVTTAQEYKYLADDSLRRFVGIASDHNFTIDDVRHLMDDGYKSKDIYFLTVLTIENE